MQLTNLTKMFFNVIKKCNYPPICYRHKCRKKLHLHVRNFTLIQHVKTNCVASMHQELCKCHQMDTPWRSQFVLSYNLQGGEVVVISMPLMKPCYMWERPTEKSAYLMPCDFTSLVYMKDAVPTPTVPTVILDLKWGSKKQWLQLPDMLVMI
jgi:hypothetical protein